MWKTTRAHGRARLQLWLPLIALALVASITTLTGAAPADAASGSLTGRVADEAGSGQAGVTVDLFRASADGSRGAFLRDAQTDGGGGYSFNVDDGCYVITIIAPQGGTFVTGSRWHQEGVCHWNGSASRTVNGTLAGSQPAPAPPPNCGQPIWNLEYEDHFSENGRAIGSEWHTYYSAGNAGYGLRRPSAISVWGGSLNIRASMENGTLVSGGMAHDLDQVYGRYEFRVRTDQDPSEGTSGVVLTWPQSGVHPRDGENNIYETLGSPGNRHEFYTFIHEPYGTVHDQDYTVHPARADHWQTMELQWMPDRMVLKRNGQVVKTLWETGEDLIPDVAHHLAIQLDAWKHSIDRPVWMQVDYVKVWSYGGTQSC